MSSKVFPTSITAPDGVLRSSTLVREILHDQVYLLEVKRDSHRSLSAQITKKDSTIERAEKIAQDPGNAMAYTETINLRGHRSALERLQRLLDDLPYEINKVQRNVAELHDELEQPEAREEVVKNAPNAQTARPANPATNAEKTANKPAPARTGMFSSALGAKKPVIRKEIIKVPAAPGTNLSGLQPASTPSTESRLGSTQSTPSRMGTASGTKRKASNDLEQQPPVRRRKLQNGKARLEQLAGRNPGSSPPASSRAGSTNQPGSNLDPAGTKQDEASSAPSMAAPTCPAMAGSSKKRSAPSEDGDDPEPAGKRRKHLPDGTNSDDPAAFSAKSPNRGKKPGKKRRELNGTINHSNSCFSGVTIQLLDAALDGHDTNAILGDLQPVEQFDTPDGEYRGFDISQRLGEPDNGLLKLQKKVRAAIKAAAKAGETEKVSAARHLRKLLDDLQQFYPGDADKNVSPYLFQAIMAWGAADDADRKDNNLSDRQRMSGDTQEDCFEYYQKVLNTLFEDPHIANALTLQELFEIETETHDVCSNKGCDYKSESRKATSNYYNIDVPKSKNEKKCTFSDLLKMSKTSIKQDPCPKCSKGALKAKTGFSKVSDNLVFRLNRTHFNAAVGQATKVETIVDLEPKIFTHQDSTYDLSAVIRHRGQSTDCGHYTIFRKHDNIWYLLDDKLCSKKDVSEVKDSTRGGHSAMLLYKKVDA